MIKYYNSIISTTEIFSFRSRDDAADNLDSSWDKCNKYTDYSLLHYQEIPELQKKLGYG